MANGHNTRENLITLVSQCKQIKINKSKYEKILCVQLKFMHIRHCSGQLKTKLASLPTPLGTLGTALGAHDFSHNTNYNWNGYCITLHANWTVDNYVIVFDEKIRQKCSQV